MKISHFISGSVTEVVQGLLRKRRLPSMGWNSKPPGGDAGFSALDFDLAVSTKTNHDGSGDVELSVLGVDLKLGNDTSKSTVSPACRQTGQAGV